MNRDDAIKQAIAQCEQDMAGLTNQLVLLRQALKPVGVPKNGTKPKGPPSEKPKTKTEGGRRSAERVRKALAPEDVDAVVQICVDAAGPLSLGEFVGRSNLSLSTIRACLNAAVEDGRIIQSGSRRSLRFLARGVEFDG